MKKLWIHLSLIVSLTTWSGAGHAIPVAGQKMAIAGPSQEALDLGMTIAQRGGNVVDVAVAVALGLAITTPYYAGFGGGGFALVGLKDGKTKQLKVDALDFRETAPKRTGPDFYKQKGKDASLKGGTAVGVPGFAAGLWELHKKHGKLSWSRIVQEPFRLAMRGFRVGKEWSEITQREKDKFTKDGLRVFFRRNGEPYLPGDRFRYRTLSRALTFYKDLGAKGFYQGKVAGELVRVVNKAGGVLTTQDFKNYKVRWLKPIETQFQGKKFYMMPPPSSGGIVIASALKLMEKMPIGEIAPRSVDEYHLLGEIMKLTFRGRSLLGDPDFHKNPTDHLTSDGYLESMWKLVKKEKTLELDPLKDGALSRKESSETTHFSVLDKDGNAVAMTLTLNASYGSGVVSRYYGIALNNEMDDFTTRPGEPNLYGLIQGKGNQVEAGKRPLSSMSPTLVAKDNEVVMSLGAPGGPRIISGVLQVIYRHLARNRDIDDAIQAPRLHHQFLPNTLFVDPQRLSPEVISGLEKKGHKVEEKSVAKVYATIKKEDGLLEAAYDRRGEGAAAAY